jgi:hypothetical protein
LNAFARDHPKFDFSFMIVQSDSIEILLIVKELYSRYVGKIKEMWTGIKSLFRQEE